MYHKASALHEFAKSTIFITSALLLLKFSAFFSVFSVSENWLFAPQRRNLLQCPHSCDGMPMKNLLRIKSQSLSQLNNEDFSLVANESASYVLRNSHFEVLRNAKSLGSPIPSLRLQTYFINRDSCRFRDETIIRDYDWDESMEHCGNCRFCKPETADGEQTVQHPTIKN